MVSLIATGSGDLACDDATGRVVWRVGYTPRTVGGLRVSGGPGHSARFGYPVQTSLEDVLVTDGESIEDQLNELRGRIIEIHELTQYNLLIGEALGLIRGMLIDLVDASDADPDDYIDDLDRLDQIANQFP